MKRKIFFPREIKIHLRISKADCSQKVIHRQQAFRSLINISKLVAPLSRQTVNSVIAKEEITFKVKCRKRKYYADLLITVAHLQDSFVAAVNLVHVTVNFDVVHLGATAFNKHSTYFKKRSLTF